MAMRAHETMLVSLVRFMRVISVQDSTHHISEAMSKDDGGVMRIYEAYYSC